MHSPLHQPSRTPHGLPAPASTSPLADAVVDIRHGAPRRIITDALARFAQRLPEDAEVLEVGAGHYDHGRFFPRLERLDADPAQHPDHLGDAHDMPLADESFDAVIAVSVLEHVDNPYRVVEEMFRVLRPGGTVFAWVPFHFAVHAFPTDISRFTEEGLRRCFVRAGFDVSHIDAEPYSGRFFNLSNGIHWTFPRDASQRWKRYANRAALVAVRSLFPLDAWFTTPTRYAGVELIARRPDRGSS